MQRASLDRRVGASEQAAFEQTNNSELQRPQRVLPGYSGNNNSFETILLRSVLNNIDSPSPSEATGCGFGLLASRLVPGLPTAVALGHLAFGASSRTGQAKNRKPPG
jgi:hypothetical protein